MQYIPTKKKQAKGLGPDETKGLPTKCLHSLEKHTGAVYGLSLTSDGSFLLSGGSDKCVRLWNPKTKLLIKEYSGHSDGIRCVKVTKDKSGFASGSADLAVIIWDVRRGEKRRLRAHRDAVNCVAYNEANNVLATGGKDRVVCLWDLRATTRRPTQQMFDFRDAVTDVCIKEASIYCTSVDGTLRCFDVRKGQCVADAIGPPLTTANVTSDGRCVLVSCLDAALRLIDTSNGKVLKTYTGHKNSEYSTGSTLHIDKYAVSVCESTSDIIFWNLTEDKACHRIEDAHNGAVVTQIVGDPRFSNVMVSADLTGRINVWN